MNNTICACYVHVDEDPNKTRIVHCSMHAKAALLEECKAHFQSITEWIKDEHDWPSNGDCEEKMDWYERRELMILNCCTTVLAKLKDNI